MDFVKKNGAETRRVSARGGLLNKLYELRGKNRANLPETAKRQTLPRKKAPVCGI